MNNVNTPDTRERESAIERGRGRERERERERERQSEREKLGRVEHVECLPWSVRFRYTRVNTVGLATQQFALDPIRIHLVDYVGFVSHKFGFTRPNLQHTGH